MKRRTKEMLRRMLAVVLIVSLLPLSDFQNCFTVKVHAAENSEVEEITVAPEPTETPEPSESQAPSETPEPSETPKPQETPNALCLTENYTLTKDTVADELLLQGGTLDLNGYNLTVQGDLAQSGGLLLVNGGSLTVEGDYVLRGEEGGKSTGLLQMTNEEDVVCILGNFVSCSAQDSTNYLKAGRMEVKGDVTVQSTYSDKAFVASGSHTLVLSGNELQTVTFTQSSSALSRLRNLEITNTSEAGVAFAEEQAVYVTGQVSDHGKPVSGYIGMVNNTTFAEGYFGGSVYISNNITLDEIIIIGGDMTIAGYIDISLSGSVTVKGSLYHNDGTLAMTKGSLTVEGDYTIVPTAQARLRMNYEEDYIHVYGDVSYNPNDTYIGVMTAGTFEVGGDFTSQRDLKATDNHRFVFSGRTKQTIDIADSCYFATVELENDSQEGVWSPEPFNSKKLITNGCKMAYGTYEGVYGWTLEEDTTYEGDLVLLEDTLDLNGHSLTITGDLVQLSGTVYVNGGSLTIEGDYCIQSRKPSEESYGRSTGRLQMTNEADYVCIKGDFISDTCVDTTNYLTAGTMEVRGDIQVGDTYGQLGFVATGSHKLLLSGETTQHVYFGVSTSKLSRLCNLEITGAGVILESEEDLTNAVYLSGEVNDHGNTVEGYIAIGTSTTFAESSFGGSVYVGQNATLNDTVRIAKDMILSGKSTVKLSGNVTVEGSLFQKDCELQMQNGRLEVKGDYILANKSNNYLYMTNEKDYLHVHGNVEYNCDYTGEPLKAGTFEIGGNFTAKDNLKAVGTHRFLFSGTRKQIISIPENGYFATVELQNNSAEGVWSETKFTRQELITNGCRISYGDLVGEYGWTLEQDTVYEGDLILLEGTLDLNGYSLTITGNLKQLSGTVFVNGGRLTVEGDYILNESKSTGRLKMTNEADYVCIKGSYLSDSAVDGTGYLTAGTLEVQGDVIVDSTHSVKSFVATDSHTLLLSGLKAQTVRFATSDRLYAGVCNLEITNISPEGVFFDSAKTSSKGITYYTQPVYVSGNVNDHKKAVSGVIAIDTTTTFTDGYFGAGVSIAQTTVLDDTLHIGGDMQLIAPYYLPITISGQITVDGSFLQTTSVLKMKRGSLEVKGDFALQNGNRSAFWMTYKQDYVHVHGNVNYNPNMSATDYLAAGTFEIGGNLTATDQLKAGGSHRFLFSGEGLQTIAVGSSALFATVELQNYSEEGVYAKAPFTSTQFITNGCRMVYGDLEGEYGWTLDRDTVYEGDLTLIEGTLDLNGHTLTVKGDLIQVSGTVFVDGGSLMVEGDYLLENKSAGRLQMTNPADNVCIEGSYLSDVCVDSTGYLTEGKLEIKGDFLVSNTYSQMGFVATDNHTLVLNGDSGQRVCFAQTGPTFSRVQNLEVRNNSTQGVNLDSDTETYQGMKYHQNALYADGNVDDGDGIVTGFIAIGPNTTFTDGTFSGGVSIAQTTTLDEVLNIGGDLELNVAVTISGHVTVSGNCVQSNASLTMQNGTLEVLGDYTIKKRNPGCVKMTHKKDYIYVHGNVSYNPYYGGESYLSAGTFEVGGNFTSTDGLYAGGTHRFLFSGTAKQIIDIGANERFATVELANYSAEGVYSETIFDRKSFIRNGCKIRFGNLAGEYGWTLTEDGIYEGDLVLLEDTLDLNGYSLTVTGDLIQTSGTVLVNGGSLTVEGDYRLQSRTGQEGSYTYTSSVGQLVMTKEGDKVTVGGDFIVQPAASTKGQLTAGTLEVKGDFTQLGSYAFEGTGNHTLLFAGENTQIWKQEKVGTVGNVINRNSRKLTINSNDIVYGKLTDEKGTVAGTGALAVASAKQLTVGSWSGRVHITGIDPIINGAIGKETLTCNLQIGTLVVGEKAKISTGGYTVNAQTITLKGRLNVENGQVICAEDFTVEKTGILTMQHKDGYLLAGGNFSIYSSKNHSGLLTEGVLELRGHFIQDDYVNFVATENHTTVLARKRTTSGVHFRQNIAFNKSAGTTRFNRLVLHKSLQNYQFKNGVETIANEVIYEIEDATAPTAVAVISVTDTTVNSVTLTFSGAEDEAGILGYEIYRDGVYVGVTANTSYTDTGLLPSKDYTYEVYPFDTYRNLAADSPQVVATTLEDTESPKAPGGVGIYTRTGSSVTLTWNPATDNVGVASYCIYRDGVEIASGIQATGYKDTGLEQNRVYRYHVVACDASGNVSAGSASVEAVVAMPQILEITPEDYSAIGGNEVLITVRLADVGNADNNRVRIEALTETGEWEALTLADLIPKTYNATSLYVRYNWIIENLEADRDYTLRITLYDADGNTDVRKLVYHVDKQAPAFPEGFAAASENGVVHLSWEASVSADCAGYKLYRKELDQDSADPAEAPYELLAEKTGHYQTFYTDTFVTEGTSYSYVLKVYDAFGNESTFSESVTVVVGRDEEAPQVKKTTPGAGRVGGRVEVLVNATDNRGVAMVQLFYRAENAQEWTTLGQVETLDNQAVYQWDTTSLADGVYVLNAVAVDRSGNASAQEFTRRYEVDNTGIAKIQIKEPTVISTAAQLTWWDVAETDFGFFQIEQLVGQTFVKIGTTDNALSFNVDGLSPNTKYTFRVVGYDNLGNRGEPSEAVEVITTTDTVAPTITAMYPVASRYRDTLELQVEAKDNHEVTKAVFSASLNGAEYQEIATVANSDPGEKATLAYTMDITAMPEGKLYVKFEVYDKAGNKNAPLSDGQDVIVEYMVDKTAPAKVEGIAVTNTAGSVGLSWTSAEEDIAYFKIYRMDGENGVFKTIQSRCYTGNYYDVSVTEGSTYTYKVSAVDEAGNEGECSTEICATVQVDREVPVITGMSPKDQAAVGADALIQVAATDNGGLSHVTLEYKKSNTNVALWASLGEISVSGRGELAGATWNTKGLTEGSYEIRAIAYDLNGNASAPYQVSYTLDTTAPVKPLVQAQTGHYEVILQIQGGGESDFAYYEITRREAGMAEGVRLGRYEGDTYTDTTATPGKVYLYQVTAYDKQGNHTVSEEAEGYADDVDVVKPKAVLPENLVGLVGMEIAFDGMGSTDNVRIVSYRWNMGDGCEYTGAQPVHLYENPGDYSVTLEVTDAAGNTSTTATTVRVYEKTGRGLHELTVVDDKGNPIPFATVYLRENEGHMTLQTDSLGQVTLASTVGTHDIAAYATGYLPESGMVNISEYETFESTIALTEDELIVGGITVRRLTLEEMVEAGVDFSNPRNMHCFSFKFTVKLQERPLKITTYYAFGTQETWTDSGGQAGEPGEEEEEDEPGNGYPYQKPPDPEPIPNESDEPVFAYVTTRQSVSWLKEMYEVQLGIINAADSEFVLADTVATLNLPGIGMSLAGTLSGQSLSQSMGDIAGQESKSVSWVVRGDQSGEYSLSADVTGTLMPFEEKVSAHFETKSEIEVTTGEGLYIYIMPQEAAYIDEDYYIQFRIVNESDRPFYNFRTSMGTFKQPTQVYRVTDLNTGEIHVGGHRAVVSDPSTISQTVIVQEGQEILFKVLYPQQEFYGTYFKHFEQPEDSEADPDEVYYALVEYLVDILEGENLGVKVKVAPMSSHIQRYSVKTEVVPNHFGDPIDLTTGAFTNAVAAMSVMGGTQLGVNFSYDSQVTATPGDLGYGWSHDYEYHVEERNGTVCFYINPSSYVTFVKVDSLESYVYGQVLDDGVLLAQGKEYSYGDYTCLYSSMADYKLTKHRDDTYTVTTPTGVEYHFDNAGRLTKLVDENGKSVSLQHDGNTTTITEDISGKHLYFNYNDRRRITSVSDGNGREISISYDDNQNISSITSVLGETVNYSYDEQHRMVSESGREGVVVTNEYDEEGRVIRQTDAFGQVMTLAYTTDESGNTTVTVIDCDGTTKQMVVDDKGQVRKVVNADGGTFTYAYDHKGNLISETDPAGNTIFREYDSRSNMVKLIDAGNLATTMTYDGHGNLLTVKGTEGRTASYTYDSRNLVTSMTDSGGMITTYGYDANGQLVRETIEGLGTVEYTYKDGLIHTVKDYSGRVTTYEYDGMGNQIRCIDNQGNVTETVYDRLGQVLKTTDAMGNTTSYTYNYLGKVASMTDAMGNTVTYEYDCAGKLLKETYPDGTSTRYQYDACGRVIRTDYADGTFAASTYDEAGNVVSETLTDGTQISYTYDLLAQRVAETDAKGNTTRYAYYPNGNLHKITYADGSFVLYTYNQAWQVNSVTDRNGNTTSYEYDARNQVTMERDALGNERHYAYDRYGRLVAETDANGNTTTYKYDANSNCIRKTNALGVSVYMEYDSLNRMTRAYTKTASGEEYSVSYTYDALGRVISTTDEMGNTTTVSYDAAGNVISATDAEGVVTQRATYDSMGRTTTVTDALGVEIRYQYDAMGNVLAVVEALNSGNRTTSYTYDKLGRLTSVTDPLAGVTKTSYDSQGNIASITDANGGVTKYSYDSMGQLIAEISPLGNASTYTYNAGGLLTRSKNARGQATTYTYDAVGRITSMTDELGTVHYTYDPNGNILTVTDKQGTISRKYDALNRVTEYTDYKGNTVKYGYDEIGNLIALTYPGGEIVRYSYYKNGWLHTVTDAKGNVTTYSYDARGNLTHTVRPNGTEEICTYNEAGLLVGQKDICGEEVLTEYTYTYDDNGNVTTVEGTETTDTEEGISRLSSAEMTYDAENRLITYNGETLRYDADGNMTYGPVKGVMSELVYDCRNRLVSAGGIRYTYDAENNRIAMETDTYREEYVTDTVSSSLSRVLTITRYEKNGTAASKGETTLCIYGSGLIYEYTGDIYLYHHYNHLGSTMKLSNASGQVIASYTYGVYGELLSGDTGLTCFLYNGRLGVTTDDNGLYYMRQRYYNPEIKRFVNQDILTGSIGNSQSLNRYSYVQGNPVSYTDPFGLSPLGSLFTGTGFAHGVLGVLGCIPGLGGAVFNAVDAWVYYYYDKDYFMATMCGISALSMGIGSVAKWAAAGSRLGKVGSYMAVTGTYLSNGLEFAQNGLQVAVAGYDMWDKYVTQGQSFGLEGVGEAAGLSLSAMACAISGVSMSKSGKQLGKMLKEDNISGRIKQTYQKYALNNGGYANLDALGGVFESGSSSRLNTYGDALRESLGPAYLSHPEEYNSILSRANELGVGVEFRSGTLAYDMEFGRPGRLIIDPEASIGALRHEYRHMLDDFELQHPGMRIIADSDKFWELEFRGYMEELNLARSIKDYEAGSFIISEMRQRRLEILGR